MRRVVELILGMLVLYIVASIVIAFGFAVIMFFVEILKRLMPYIILGILGFAFLSLLANIGAAERNK